MKPSLKNSKKSPFYYQPSYYRTRHRQSPKSRGMAKPPQAESFKNKKQCSDAPTTTCNPAEFIEWTSLLSKSVQESYYNEYLLEVLCHQEVGHISTFQYLPTSRT
jgi:hypothetical protein